MLSRLTGDAVVKDNPQPSQPTPESLYPDVPAGGDYGSLLAYFVRKNIPTFRFADLPPDKACVAMGCAYLAIFVPIPMAYLYLDNSMTSECWYYVYRYLANGSYATPPSVGVYKGNGPMSLIGDDPSRPPADALLPFLIPSPGNPPNPNLVQVSIGKAPVIVLS
jgi:hypothetical protein